MAQIFDIVICKAKSELKAETTRNYAGFLWWFLEPFMSLLIYFVVFKYILNIPRDVMALFCGLITFKWFSSSLARSTDDIIDGRRIMMQVYLHKSVFPLSTVAVNTFKFSLVLLMTLGIALIMGRTEPTLAWLSLPIILGLAILLLTGSTFCVAAITPFLPDMSLIIGTLLQLFMWVSCVFYNLSDLSPRIQTFLKLNPVAVVINEIRSIILYGNWPVWEVYPLLIAQITIIFALGFWLLNKYNRIYPKMTF